MRHAPGYPPTPRCCAPTDVIDFATLYGQNCAACHGAERQNGAAMDLANPEYQALVDDARCANGSPTECRARRCRPLRKSAGGMLTDEQIDALVAGMRKQWSQPNAFAERQPPPYRKHKAGDAQRGQQAYQPHCAVCHSGNRGSRSPSPAYLALISDQSLRSIIIAGRPGHRASRLAARCPRRQSRSPLQRRMSTTSSRILQAAEPAPPAWKRPERSNPRRTGRGMS